MNEELWTVKLGLRVAQLSGSLFGVRYADTTFVGSTPARAVKRFEKWFNTGFDDNQFERQETA